MKTVFFLSSIGDTDLALNIIKKLQENNSGSEAVIIALTNAAKARIENFNAPSVVAKLSINDLIGDEFSPDSYNNEQLQEIISFLSRENIGQAYFGVPSINNETPFKIAKLINNMPVFIAYEFMFKPEKHCLWDYVAELKQKPNVQWGIPLPAAIEDFGDDAHLHITGHMSIDNAYHIKEELNTLEIKNQLSINDGESCAFLSCTTQPIEIDREFIDCILAELPNHPNIQLRIGIHPGIQDLDAYFAEILPICQRYSVTQQFKIILPDNLIARFKSPENSINHPEFHELFLRVNVNGNQAASVADRVTQAVPGALLNQALIEGKPVYSHFGKSYLPRTYFAENIATFFQSEKQSLRGKEEFGLDEKSAPECYANLMS